ncbi:MAG: metallophosphoesterase [Planctomycetes bacterium]|nr:metallophosphoesterase [Planctomycetota bacterium]
MSRVKVNTVQVRASRLPAEFEGLRIAQLSDLHLRRWNGVLDETRRRLLELDPELVVITGDIGDAHAEAQRSADLAARLLEGVHPSLGCFGVLGNHDDPQLAEQLSGHVRMMSNEHVNLTKAGGSMMIAGVDGRTPTSGDIPSALLGIKLNSFIILLAHHPPLVYRLPPNRVGLMLAGHTHAGQIRLPGIGPLWPNFEGIPRKYCRGLHEVNGTCLHVSAGVGCSWAVPFRIGCPPEIALITLTGRSAAVQ